MSPGATTWWATTPASLPFAAIRARPEDPGAMKVFGYKEGILTSRQSIAPNGGYGFQSRNLDFHPTGPWVYPTLEVQSKLVVYRRINNNESLDPAALFTKETLQDPAHVHRPAQQAGPVFVHPNGRFVYTTNRTNGTIDRQTGEPVGRPDAQRREAGLRAEVRR